MPFLPDLNGEFCLRLTLTLLHFLWQGVAIALLAAGAGAALRRAGAAARYWVFVAALGAMALCPPITYHTLTRLEGIALPAALSADSDGVSGGDAGTDSGTGLGMGLGAGLKPAPTGVGTSNSDVSQPGNETRIVPAPLLPVGAGEKPDPAVERPQPDASLLKRVSQSVSRAFASDAYARVAPWVAGGYFAGVLVMLTRLLLALRGGRGLRRQSRPVTEPALRAMFERAATAVRLSARPALAWCERVAVPTVVGLLKPTILLPLSLSSGLAPEQIEMLLLHELAHLRRHDHWVNLAQWVVETAMFFHPAVWWVSRRIRAERELACDDCVLATGVAEASYANSLLRMAELSRLAATASDNPNVALALGSHGSRFSGFGQRVLRLIEGRESLESLRPARVWPVAVALVVLLAGCYAIACRPEAPDTRQSNDPLGIQYRGLQVGLSDSLYNPNGEKIGERLNWQYASGSLFSKEKKRRLVFDFPKTPEPIFFGSLQMFCGGTPAEKRAWRKKTKGLDRILGGMELRAEMDGPTRQLIADFSGPSPGDHLDFPAVGDIVLHYYYGPPGKSLYRFSAPFIQDREQRDQGGTLCPQKHPRFGADNYSLTYFTLKLETPIERAKDGSFSTAIACDKAGKRYQGTVHSRYEGKTEDWLTDLEFFVNVPIGEIETITIEEKPYEVWVKGVQVTPPGSEEETRNEMAEIARVFEIPDMKYDQLLTYDFKANPDKALRSFPLFRGYPFNHALRAIPSEKFQGQPPEYLKQLHQTALRLSQAPLPHWKAGIWMGFQGAWPEFYGLALDHLADPELQNFITFHREGGEGTSSFIIADFFSKHSQEFPDDLVPKIEKAVSVVEESFVFSNLMKCLTDKKTSTTTEALLRLAKDEHPWIWVSALKELSTRKALAPEESLTPPERIRLTVARALSGSLPEKTVVEPEVESVLLMILSDGAKNLSPTHILDTLHRYDDPKTTLRAAVEFLQKQNPYGYRYNIWPIPTVTRWINQNYGVNIGELGTGSPNDLSYEKMSPTQLGKQITDTCTWYEQSEYFNGTPLKRPFFQNSPEEQAGETKDAPLDIRFSGFQVGLGDSLYNQEGKKIGERVNWPYEGPSKTDMNWRFIFDLPGTEELPLFEEGAILYESGKDRKEGSVGGGMRCPEIETDGTSRQLLYEARIDFSSRGKKPPQAVDICVRYFSGPPREPLYTFSGPFEEGKILEEQGATLSLKEYSLYNATSLFSFKARIPEDGSFHELPVLVSEKSGKRRLARWGSGGSRSDGTYREIQEEIRVERIPLEEIASISIGEKPLEFWVRNIQVAPSGAEEETKARLAEIVRVLEVPCEDYKNLSQYNFKANRDKALQCLPLLRGAPFYTLWNTIMSNPISVQDASPELRERIHQAALKLAKAPAPHCKMGSEMGLWGRWPEFYALALEQHAGFFWISRRSAEIPEELIPRIQEILGATENADEYRSWMTCLIDKQTSSTTEALRSFAKSERPWLWVPAYFQLWTRKALPPDETLSPQEKLRLATARAINDYNPSPDQEIGRGLVEMLTLEARRMTGRSFDFTKVVRGVHRYCDRETGTRALVDYIQRLGPDDRYHWEVEQVVHWINQDYGVNIGGLGVRPDQSPQPLSLLEEKQLIADILTWQKTGVVPGGYVAEKPVVLEFPSDRSIGTIETGESGKFEMQGRIKLPPWASLRLDIKKKPDSISVLEQFKSCRVLDLSIYGAGFRDEDFQFLRSFTTLKILTLVGVDITGAGLENLTGLTNLTRLDFSSSRISGQGLGALQSCSSLKTLCLSYCQVTDAEMADLSGMPGLTTLLLGGTQISDASIKVLKQFQGLRVLNLEKTRITPQGAAELKKFLPNCNVSVSTVE